MPEPLRWGVLGAARIAREKVIPAMRKTAAAEVLALASRDVATARAAADPLRIPRAYGGYEALLADPDVEAVYVPLPNHLHVDWSIRALEAGKHVLCEKPLGMDADEVARLRSAADAHPRLKVMEAFMYRLHPQWVEARRLAQTGVGRLQTIHSHFSYVKYDRDNIRNRPETGGGGLRDIGVYDVSLSRWLFGSEPARVVATVEFDPEMGVDRLVSALLDFGQGRTATFTCGTQLHPYQRVHAFGDEGRFELEIPFNAPQDGPCRLWHATADGRTCETVFDRVDQYTLQAEAFARAVRDDVPVPVPLADAWANQRVVDAIFESGRRGGWVPV